MTDTQATLMPAQDDVQLLVRDLDWVCGTLSEIATVWRRALAYLPDLPPSIPVRLQDAARQLTAGAQALAAAGPGQPPDLALRAAGELFALRDDIASARAMTNGPGIPDLGDARLWESLSAALDRAGNQLLSLILHLVKIKNWSLSDQTAAGVPHDGQAGLLVQLG